MQPNSRAEHVLIVLEPKRLERVHEGEALKLLGRSAELFEPFTTLMAEPNPTR